jgi:hypothetical protein
MLLQILSLRNISTIIHTLSVWKIVRRYQRRDLVHAIALACFVWFIFEDCTIMNDCIDQSQETCIESTRFSTNRTIRLRSKREAHE